MTKTLNKKDLFWIFVRSNFLLGSFNFERMQAMGFCVSLIPALKKLYQGDELKAALKRHLEFFNTQPFLGAAIMGIIAAMEEKRANGIGGNKMRYLTEGSSVLGLLVMGALVAKWTTVNMPLVLSEYVNAKGEVVVTTVQSILDSLMPGIVPLLMTFACMYLLRKGVNPLIIILGLFAIGIVGYAIGLLA